jgi:hypothetical protein
MVKVGYKYCLNGLNNHSPFCACLGFSPNNWHNQIVDILSQVQECHNNK